MVRLPTRIFKTGEGKTKPCRFFAALPTGKGVKTFRLTRPLCKNMNNKLTEIKIFYCAVKGFSTLSTEFSTGIRRVFNTRDFTRGIIFADRLNIFSPHTPKTVIKHRKCTICSGVMHVNPHILMLQLFSIFNATKPRWGILPRKQSIIAMAVINLFEV